MCRDDTVTEFGEDLREFFKVNPHFFKGEEKNSKRSAREIARRRKGVEQTKAVEFKGDQQQKCSELVPLEHGCCKKTIALESTYFKI